MWSCPFLSAVEWSRALSEWAPIAEWSGYKTGLVLDILALLSLFVSCGVEQGPFRMGSDC